MFTSVTDLLDEVGGMLQGRGQHLGFLFPTTATCSAALTRRGNKPLIELRGDAASYAETIGLAAILDGQIPTRRPLVGKTYSPIVELHTHAEVDSCNAVINELIRHQLNGYPALAGQACQIVGELHDNVPSHANGPGFSMAQYFRTPEELEIAVVDCGQGMLRNVTRRDPGIRDHQSAIAWCMERGHTTAEPPDEWAQRLPEDALNSPFQSGTSTRHTDNHHAGLGLWKLEQIATAAGGSLVVWSGDFRLRLEAGQRTFEPAPEWQGVAVVLRLPIAGNVNFEGQSNLGELEALAKRLNL